MHSASVRLVVLQHEQWAPGLLGSRWQLIASGGNAERPAEEEEEQKEASETPSLSTSRLEKKNGRLDSGGRRRDSVDNPGLRIESAHSRDPQTRARAFRARQVRKRVNCREERGGKNAEIRKSVRKILDQKICGWPVENRDKIC